MGLYLLHRLHDAKASVWASFSLHALNYETPPSYHDSHALATFFYSPDYTAARYVSRILHTAFTVGVLRGLSVFFQ